MTSLGMPVVATLDISSSSCAASLSLDRGHCRWQGAHKGQCKLMKKHIELARKSCKLFRQGTFLHSTKSPVCSSAWRESDSTPTHSSNRDFLRHSAPGSGGSVPSWSCAAAERREREERERSSSKQPFCNQPGRRSGPAGYQGVTCRATSTFPNAPGEARIRAYESEPAHPSHQGAAPAGNITPTPSTQTATVFSAQQAQGSHTLVNTAFTEATAAQRIIQQPEADTNAELEPDAWPAIQQLAQLVSSWNKPFMFALADSNLSAYSKLSCGNTCHMALCMHLLHCNA